MSNYLNVFDFKSILKRTYYGCKDPEAMRCEKTGRSYAHWYAAAPDLITRWLRPVMENGQGPRDMIVAHDMGHEFRKGIYDDYKSGRAKAQDKKSPIEVEQLRLLETWAKKFFRAVGVLQIGVKGVEADDVVAWIVTQAEKAGIPSTIHTVDFDLAALVTDLVQVHTLDYTFTGADGVFDTPGNDLDGIPFRLASFAKSILGDSSDSYGGVKGMGPAAVRKLIESFGLDGFEELKHIVDSNNREALQEICEETGDKGLIKLNTNFDDWRMGWRLAQLRPELCWKPRKNKLVKPIIDKRIPNAADLVELLKEIDAVDLWENEDLCTLVPTQMLVDATNWGEMREAIFEEIEAGNLMAFDYEGSDKDPIKAFRKAATRGNNFVDTLSQEVAGMSMQFGKNLENVIYIPIDHRDSMNLNKDVIKEILEFCQKRVKRRLLTMVAHNAFFEGVVTYTNFKLRLENVHDTRIMQRFFNENEMAGLKFLSMEYLHYKQDSFLETLAKGSIRPGGARMMCELTAEETLGYGADDSLVTGHLHDLLKIMLILDGQWNFYEQWAVRPTEVLQRSYLDGVRMNWALQRRLHERDLKAIAEGKVELREILQKNVTGNITPGAKSLIEAEREYIYRSALKKTDSKEEASLKLSEWRKKVENSCQYTPYTEELVMPQFAFTVKQVSAAATAVGLPALPGDNISVKAWNGYLEAIGAVGFRSDWDLTEPQVELVTAVSKAINQGLLKAGDLRTERKTAKEGRLEEIESELDVLDEVKAELGEVVQRLADVQPRTISMGDELNVGSPTQMQRLLYCKIGVPVRLRGKLSKNRLAIGIREAAPSTDEKSIEWARANDIEPGSWQAEALDALYKVKSASTRVSLYHAKYPLWLHRDGMVHHYITDYGTDTGRPTGSAPNTLQVSKKDKVMRSIYIPPNEDYLCVAIDFNGQEIRLMANLTQDPVLMSVYDPADEKDLHSMTGSGVAKVSYEVFKQVLDDKTHPDNGKYKIIRNKKAKPLNFGIAYGAGAGTLSRNMVAPLEEAKTLLEDTMSLYQGIRPWQQASGEFMVKNGFTLTAYGCKRHATPDIFSTDEGKVKRQQRQGANFEIQGTAADMLRIALTKVADSGMLDRLRMSFFAPIYDEVVAWVHKDDVYDYCHEMGAILESTTPPGHKVRQVPEYSIGPDWGRVEEMGRDISPENVAKFVAEALEAGRDIWEKDALEPFNPIMMDDILEMEEEEYEAALEEPEFD